MFVSAILSPTLVMRTPPHTTRSADAVRMAATMAPPSAQPGATRILVPEFPEVCEQTGITLTRYMCEVARANPELQELESLLAAIQTAGKTINSLVNRAHITGLVGYADGGGSINVQGEEQKTLDIVTNDVLKKALRFTGKMGVIASEEEDNPVDTSDMAGLPAYETTALMDETGRYTAVFDPLDGSSNVDAGIPTGTIFGIFDAQDCLLPEEACDTADEKFTGDTAECSVDAPSAECLAATLQPGTSLVASGYILYSSSTFFALTLGAGVQARANSARNSLGAQFGAVLRLTCGPPYRSLRSTSQSASSSSRTPTSSCRAAAASTRSTRPTACTGTRRCGATSRTSSRGSARAASGTARGTLARWSATSTARCSTAASSATPPTRRTRTASCGCCTRRRRWRT